MIARVAMMAIVLITALLTSTVVLGAVSSGVWQPDLVVLTVVAFALADGPGTGARYGFVAGLVVDLLSAATHLVGTTALVLALVGYGSGAVRPYLSATGLAGQVALATAATMLAVAAYGLLAQLLEVDSSGLLGLVRSTMATGLYNAVLAPLVLVPVTALSRRLSDGSSSSTR